MQRDNRVTVSVTYHVKRFPRNDPHTPPDARYYKPNLL